MAAPDPAAPALDRPAAAPPDRYAEAVLARRRELRARRAQAGPGHRAALRDALTHARADAATTAGSLLAALRREAAEHLAGPAPRALVALLPPAEREVEAEVHRCWERAAGAAVRRTAADHGLRVPAGWPEVAAPPPADLPGPPPRPGAGAALADPGVWRVAALPLVLAPPAVALGWVHGGPALLLPAVGAAVLVLVAVVRRRRAALDRARVARWADELLDAAGGALDTGAARAAAGLAARAGAELDAALDRHRAALDAELALITTGAGAR